MIIKADQHLQPTGGAKISAVCPSCGKQGVFEMVHNVSDAMITPAFVAGVRICPDPACRTKVFTVWNPQQNKLVVTYPAQKEHFDSTNVPKRIVESFNESLTCLSQQCFKASALMIRRTLEEICSDKGANGDNLLKKIDDRSHFEEIDDA